MGRSRYRRRHPPHARRRHPPGGKPPTTSERLLTWATAVLVVIVVFWLADTRSGLLRQHGSPLLALLVDAGVVAVVALAVVLRRTRR